MAIAFRGTLASNSNNVTGTTVTFSVSTGWTTANPQAGDMLVCIVMGRNTTASTWSQTAGTSWTFHSNSLQVTTSGGVMAMAASLIHGAGDTDPTFTISNTSATAWAVIALTPDAGDTMKIDLWATDKLVTVGASNITPNSATASGTGEASVVMVAEVNTATGKNTSGLTMPTGYTANGGNSAYVGASGQFQHSVGIGAALSQSGTVTPGAANYGTSTLVGVALHVLLTETVPSLPPPGLVIGQAVKTASLW